MQLRMRLGISVKVGLQLGWVSGGSWSGLVWIVIVFYRFARINLLLGRWVG